MIPMDRPPYLLLLLAAVVMGVVLVWALYAKFFSSGDRNKTTDSATQPSLLERMQDRLAATRAATQPSTQTSTTAPIAPTTD